jgi:diguanylate cyclase (GGDEF)-like protein
VDVVGRLGGDEFAVLLTETSADGSTSVIARLQSHLQARLGASAGVTFSIGAVTCETPPDDVDDVIRAADAAMYRAKRAGKGRVERVVVAAAEGRRGSKGARG